MSNDTIDHVRRLAPEVAFTELDRARQRRRLDEAIVARQALLDGGLAPPRRPRRTARGLSTRRRAYLAGAAAAVAAAAGMAIPLSLGTGTPAASRATTPPTKSAAPVMRLASYRLQLPTSYHLTAATTSNCRRSDILPGNTATSSAPVELSPAKASRVPDYASAVAAQANAEGGSICMLLTDPYTPSATTPDPFDGGLANPQSVQVGTYQGVVGTRRVEPPGVAITLEELYVTIPLAGGQDQDVVITGTGLSQSALVTLVANGLSVANSSVPSSASTPSGSTGVTGGTGSAGASGTSGIASGGGSSASTGTTTSPGSTGGATENTGTTTGTTGSTGVTGGTGSAGAA